MTGGADRPPCVIDAGSCPAAGAGAPDRPGPIRPALTPAARAFWEQGPHDPAAWRVALPVEAAAEIAALVRAGLPGSGTRPDAAGPDDPPVACAALMAEVRRRVLDGPGFAVVGPLPLDRLGPERSRAVFWRLCQLLSRPVATKWDGTLMYDVRDTGRGFGIGVRGSTTRVELSFHTDNAFGLALPQLVGLLCLQPARSGGVSRVTSLAAAHDALLARHPELLARLYQPMYFDRQGEHAPGQPEILRAPLFARIGAGLEARLTPNLVRRGYRRLGLVPDPALEPALQQLEAEVSAPHRQVEFRLEAGEIQVIHNHACAHYRSAFEDADGERRHLIRVWFRETGSPHYDGQDACGGAGLAPAASCPGGQSHSCGSTGPISRT